MCDLRPCPFCGKMPVPVVDEETETLFGIKCFYCGGAISPEKETLQDAVEAWNRRAEGEYMSVLVKGMDMPTCCADCDFHNPFSKTPYCRRLLKVIPLEGRLENCPLVEVTPYGRLIAADAVERKKGKWIDSYDLQGNKYKRCSECGVRIETTFFANDYSVIFCPQCGADMREESNGES